MTGLVLAGGRSSRFGSDKSRAVLHPGAGNMTEWSCRLLASLPGVEYAAVSCRPAQAGVLRQAGLLPIPDEADGPPTPLRGLVAALKAASTAVLVMPCDLPLMTAGTLSLLLDVRRKRREEHASALLRTCFVHADGRTEPLVAVYEFSSLPRLEAALHEGRFGIHSALPSWGNSLVPCPEETAFLNMNTPEERERALLLINGKENLRP